MFRCFLDTDAYYCRINIVLAKISIENNVIIEAITRSYTDFFSAADGDGVYPDLNIDTPYLTLSSR